MALTGPTTEDQIAKLALSHLKGENITSVSPADAGSKEARIMALWMGAARQYALQQHPWDFARKRVEIAADGTDPAFEYDKRYELPADFLRLVRVGENWYDPDGDYQPENGFLLSNEPAPLKVVYIYDLQDVSKMSPTFKIYLSYVLAAFGCYDITGAKDMVPLMFEAAEEFLSKTKQINMQARPPRKIQSSRIRRARMALGSRNDEPWRWGDE